MKTLSVGDTAEELNISEEEVKRLCKAGALELVDIGGGLPQVSMRSISDFKCEEITVKPKAKKQGGRPPKVLTYEGAVKLLNESKILGGPFEEAAIVEMVLDNELEPYDIPGSIESGVTKRSLTSYIVDAQKKDSENAVDHASNDAQDTETEEGDLTDVNRSYIMDDLEPIVTEKSANAWGENLLKSVGGSVGHLFDADQIRDMFDANIDALVKSGTEDHSDELIDMLHNPNFLRPLQNEDSSNQQEVIALSKKDFRAAVVIASMKGELSVYRKLKSFERLD